MSGTEAYLRNPDIALREEDESGSLLFNPDTGEVLVVNDTGRFIWDLCEKAVTMNEILRRFGEVYENIPEKLSEDVEKFVSAMTKGGFIASR